MPTPTKPTRLSPAERQAARAERQKEARIRRAERILRRAKADRGIKRRLLAGLDDETIARGIADRADTFLDFDGWLNGPIGEPVGDVLEVVDGPALYEAALVLIRAVKAALVRAGKLAA